VSEPTTYFSRAIIITQTHT